MAGLLGRKLGMTQVFDPEDGHVERVTVIEAGPCFVTGIRRADRDGYDAVQVAFGDVREKKITRPELGHLKKADVGPMRHLREFRGDPGELELGNELKVDAVFEKGQTVKVSGLSKGKGFAGTVKRHNFSRGPVTHGSHNVRAPGSIGASARSRARVQGHPRSRPDGQQARDPARPRDRRRPPRRQPAAAARLGARPQGRRRRDQDGRRDGRSGSLHRHEDRQDRPRRGRVRRALPRPARARGRARRAGRAPQRQRRRRRPAARSR